MAKLGIHGIILLVISILAFILLYPGIFFPAFKISSQPFNYIELMEIQESYNSKPLGNIFSSSNSSLYNETVYPLLGKYKGLRGGHKYDYCNYLFDGTCKEHKNYYNDYCPSNGNPYDEYHNIQELDWDTCIDFTEIPETNYTYYKDKFLYAVKSNNEPTYEMLLKNTITEKEKCPENQKSCGYLNKDLVLCYDKEHDCPINDIIFNDESYYTKNGIEYKTIQINDNEYIHFTNENIENQIIFDLIISIEHPLSRIEIPEKFENYIFQLSDYENEYYYRGSIDNIKVYKQIYDTNISYIEQLEAINISEIIKTEPEYKTQYFSSKMFIYKKYPIPMASKTSYEDIKKFNDDLYTAYVLNFVSAALLCPFMGFSIVMINNDSFLIKVILYVVSTIIHSLIFFFCFFKYSSLTNNDILVGNEVFEEKDHHRVQLLCFHISYIVTCAIHNISFIFYLCREKCDKNNNNDLDTYHDPDTPYIFESN